MTPSEVAQFMLDSMGDKSWLYQETIVQKIKRECGEEHVWRNPNGNLAIKPNVLAAFRKLTEGKLVWSRGERAWRTIRPGQIVKGRQTD
jgi:hypothetical protein